ncbi:Rpn family recombination-promoting nuclease/putative transposase [Chroococcus sp. FPU101]|uniref:Rpn family recombination-promoting nuclease/putative transposase n=1 Tax=Chroococcus sp. FPU101 TaxID=1974212 RepID=UPI001A8C7235|nr:Rpn family recombination-promoting nuclease/putative transposase [Chroococcus sp. FPU101]GFE68360.1 hypothetical protein CFPU101_09700 [Chroococcus sp. FPU101]
MKTDKIFYTLFKAFPQLLFELTGQNTDLAQVYEFTSVEVKELAFRIDGLFLPKTVSSDKPIYFVEVQFQKDPDFYWRFITEIFLYLGTYQINRPWRAIVIWAKASLNYELPIPYQDFVLNQRLDRIYLNELAKSDRQSVGISILKFIASSQSKAPEQFPLLLEQVEQEIIEVPQKKEVIELIEKIIIYKFPKKSRKELERMFNLTDWKKTQFYREVKQEGKLETIPLLLRLGLTAEQISTELGLELELVRQAIKNYRENN